MPWVREDPALYQRQIDAIEHPRLETDPNGAAGIETYTVVFGREGQPEVGIVVGRLENGDRFCAHVPKDAALLDAMTREDFLGRRGKVVAGEPVTVFTPDT